DDVDRAAERIRVRGAPEPDPVPAGDRRVVVTDEFLVALPVARAHADLRVGQGTMAVEQRLGEDPTDEIRGCVDLGAIRVLTGEDAYLVIELLLRDLPPHHEAELLGRRRREVADGHSPLHEGDELVAGPILHGERRKELPD